MSKRSRIGAGFVALCIGAACAADGSDIVRFTDIAGLMQKQLTNDCANYRRELTSATDFKSKNRAEQGIIVNCECGPAGLEKITTDPQAPREIERSAAQSVFLGLLAQCGMVGMQRTLADVCLDPQGPVGAEVGDRKKYCGCMNDQMTALTDDTFAKILADIRAQHFSPEEMRQRATPADFAQRLEQFDRDCRAAKPKAPAN